MSSRSSLFLTLDNEHCYEECNSLIYNGKQFKGYEIVLEIDPKNGTCDIDGQGNISIYLNNPDSKIYKLIMFLKDKEELLRT